MKVFFRSMSQCTVYSNMKDLFEYTKFYFTCIKNNLYIGIPWREENLNSSNYLRVVLCLLLKTADW